MQRKLEQARAAKDSPNVGHALMFQSKNVLNVYKKQYYPKNTNYLYK